MMECCNIFPRSSFSTLPSFLYFSLSFSMFRVYCEGLGCQQTVCFIATYVGVSVLTVFLTLPSKP